MKETEFGKIGFFNENGVRGAVIRRSDSESINISLMIKRGSDLNPENKGGAVDLFASMLSKGTKSFSAMDIAEKLDYLGADFTYKIDKDSVIFNFWFLKEHFQKIFPLVEEIFLYPQFPEDELEREKLKTLSSLYQIVDSPSALASYIFTKNIYSDHPYGNLATPFSINSITVEDIKKIYENSFTKDLIYLVISGNISDKARKQIISLFKALPHSSETKKIEKAEYRGNKFIFFDKKDSTQSQIRLGFGGISRRTENYEAINLMNFILGGGGFSSRLLLKVRTEAGYTYSISSSFESFNDGGSFVITSFSKNETTAETIKLSEKVLREFKKNGATEKELKDDKAYFIGNLILSMETPSDIAGKLMYAERYGLGEDFLFNSEKRYKRVSLEEVNKFSKELLNKKDRLLVIVGNLNSMKKKIDKLKDYGKLLVIENPFDSEK